MKPVSDTDHILCHI